MPHKFNLVNTLLFAVLSTAIVAISGCSPASSTTQVNIIKPVKLHQIPYTEQTMYDAFWAEVDAGNRSKLSFQVPGVISELTVRDGERIKKGQILAKLDPTDYQLAVKASQAQYQLAKTRHLRNKQLYTKNLISTDLQDRSETALKAAEANLEEAKTDLSYTQIKAPFDGIVSLSFVKAHQFVAAKMPVLNLINNDQLDITIAIPVPYVDELGIDNLKQQNFMVAFDIHSAIKIPAQFKEMSTQADSDTNSYNATVSLIRPAGINILTGMTGQVLISNTRTLSPIHLPSGAWIEKNTNTGKLWRFNPQSQSVEKIDVALNEYGAISSGLNEGDFVVIAGAKDLKDAQVVRAWKREGGI